MVSQGCSMHVICKRNVPMDIVITPTQLKYILQFFWQKFVWTQIFWIKFDFLENWDKTFWINFFIKNIFSSPNFKCLNFWSKFFHSGPKSQIYLAKTGYEQIEYIRWHNIDFIRIASSQNSQLENAKQTDTDNCSFKIPRLSRQKKM